MKHLKRYNESKEDIQTLGEIFLDLVEEWGAEEVKVPEHLDRDGYYTRHYEISVPVPSIVNNPRELGVDLNYSSYVSVHESIEDAIDGLDEDRFNVGEIIFSMQNIGHEYSSVVNLLDWNETNFQEIENILFDYGIHVENIWAFLK